MVFFLLQQTRMLRHPLIQIRLEGGFDPIHTCGLPQHHPSSLDLFSQLLKQLKNYQLWNLSKFLTETPHYLHIHSINTFYLLPTNASLHSCILLFWIMTIYLQTYLFIIYPFNHHIISSLSFNKCTISFFSQLRVHFHSPVYRYLVLP